MALDKIKKKYFDQITKELKSKFLWFSDSRISALVKKYYNDKTGYKNVVEEIFKQTEGVYLGAFPTFAAMTLETYKKQLRDNIKEFGKQRMFYNFDLIDQRKVDMMASNTAFTYAQNYQFNNLPKLQAQLKDYWIKGTPIDELIPLVSKDLNSVGKRAIQQTRTVINTQVTHVGSMADLNQYSANNIKYYEFVAIIDNRTTAVCEGENGKRYGVEKELKAHNKVINDVSGIINKGVMNGVDQYKISNQVNEYYYKNKPFITQSEKGKKKKWQAGYKEATKSGDGEGKQHKKYYSSLNNVPNATLPPLHFNCRSFVRAVFLK